MDLAVMTIFSNAFCPALKTGRGSSAPPTAAIDGGIGTPNTRAGSVELLPAWGAPGDGCEPVGPAAATTPGAGSITGDVGAIA